MRGVIPLDKHTLKQHRALEKEIPKLEKELKKLYERLDKVPIVSGKVTKSGDEFPYIEEHITVEMAEPKEAEKINKQIRIKKSRLESAEKQRTIIEEFIASIPDSIDRQIFELSFLEGKYQIDIAEELGMERSNVSKHIKAVLKLSHISHN